MGTYGITHIKKDNKIIPFSDSYDGYWSGMGQANLIGLKHIPLTILAKLFDNFTARKPSPEDIALFEEPSVADDIDDEVSQRKISNFIKQVGIDTNHNQQAIDWAKSAVLGDIRASALGVVPLLYMNIHPHYGYNYDEADYIIDLDNSVFKFVHTDLSLHLDSIEKTHELNIVYFFENDFSLIDNTVLPDGFTSIEDFLYDITEENKEEQLQKLKLVIDAIFSISVEQLENYFNKKEEERQKHIAQYTTSLLLKDEDRDNASYSYSFHTAEVSSQQLRNILFFLQEKAKEPSYAFILDCVEWGLDENYIEGGIRFKSPDNSQQYEKFSEIMTTLEYSLKQKFNIMSGAGTSISLSSQLEDNLTINKSIFSFKELKNMLSENDFSLVMNEGLPYLAYHTYLDEAVSHIISQHGKTNSPVFWVFVALLSQNKDLFNSVYDKSKEQLATFDITVQAKIKNLYLSSYYDGILLAQLLNKNSDFAKDIQNTLLFKDCIEILNDIEKQTLLN